MKEVSHRNLPHLDIAGALQFITWRCQDSIPRETALLIQEETDHLKELDRWKERARRIEAIMDKGLGECPLAPAKHGSIMKDVLLRYAGDLYELRAWVVMPNHVHVLLTVMPGIAMSKAMNQLKGVSAREINIARRKSGALWQAESFDRFARDDAHAGRIAEYIHYNPVKAGLVLSADMWPLSSARELDGSVAHEAKANYGEPFDPFVD